MEINVAIYKSKRYENPVLDILLYKQKNGWLSLFSDHKKGAVVYGLEVALGLFRRGVVAFGLEGPLGLTKFSIESDQLMALTFKHFMSNANNFSAKNESEYDLMSKTFLLLEE